jgi:hypothetical protein
MLQSNTRVVPFLYAAIMLVAACGTPAPGSDPDGDKVASVRLVSPDSTTDEAGTTWIWYRVAVATAGREDTLAGIMARDNPVRTSDGYLNGLSFDSAGMVHSGYRYSPGSRTLELVKLPSDISPYSSEAAISQNGRFFAYIAQDSNARTAAVIKAWPVGSEIARADAGPGFPSDVNFNHLRWSGSDQAEFWIRVEGGNGPWVHIVLSPSGVTRIDSTSKEPRAPQRG